MEKPRIFEESLAAVEHTIHNTIDEIVLKNAQEWKKMKQIRQLTVTQLTTLRDTLKNSFRTFCVQLSPKQVDDIVLNLWQHLEVCAVGVFAAVREDHLEQLQVTDALHQAVKFLLWGSSYCASQFSVEFDLNNL